MITIKVTFAPPNVKRVGTEKVTREPLTEISNTKSLKLSSRFCFRLITVLEDYLHDFPD